MKNDSALLHRLIRMLLQKLFYPIVKVVGHDMNPADVVVGGSASAV